jgi:hypothetical protein
MREVNLQQGGNIESVAALRRLTVSMQHELPRWPV